MIPIARPRVRASAIVLAVLLSAGSVAAQQQPPFGSGPRAPAPGANPARAAPPGARDAGGDSSLRQRIEQLEEQLVDMQVVIGTLESLAKGVSAPVGQGQRPSPGVAAALSGADAGRIDALETRIQALTVQLEQLQDQIRTLAGRSGSLAPSSSYAANEQTPRPGRSQVDALGSQPDQRPGFGAMTVSPDQEEKDDIDRLLTGPSQPGSGPPAGGTQVATSAPFGGPAADASPKQLYETAYGYLMQRDYAAAESAFESFLKRYPSDPLAANAQYWLGESLYVRGQYRAAASAFLKGYQSYGKSAKAPESLLKLAMSLQRLGQKDAACSSYSELVTKFPNAPAHVKNTAQAERQRGGCGT